MNTEQFSGKIYISIKWVRCGIFWTKINIFQFSQNFFIKYLWNWTKATVWIVLKRSMFYSKCVVYGTKIIILNPFLNIFSRFSWNCTLWQVFWIKMVKITISDFYGKLMLCSKLGKLGINWRQVLKNLEKRGVDWENLVKIL